MKAIYYINDDAKAAVIEQATTSFKDANVINNIDVVVDNSNVILTMQPDLSYAQDILGYEVIRVTTNQGQYKRSCWLYIDSNYFSTASRCLT
mgnify:CR=1 FL=1